ncbi:MAG: hypothetical protein QF645_06450, partial [Planctomycetota bacterium]|nr:hypothetical protein [Planctomycetota bacterium]
KCPDWAPITLVARHVGRLRSPMPRCIQKSRCRVDRAARRYRWQTYGLGVKSQTVSGTAKALTVSYILSKYGKEWDSYSQTPYYAWSSGGDYYQVWYDDAESFALKFDAAHQAGYGGIGMWKLPWATDDIWNEIKKYQEAE